MMDLWIEVANGYFNACMSVVGHQGFCGGLKWQMFFLHGYGLATTD